MDYGIGSVCVRRNDFQKADNQGENPFAKGAPRTASNAFVQALSLSEASDTELHCWPHAQWTWTLFPKTPILLRRKEEKWLIGVSAHDKWVRFQLTVKILVPRPVDLDPLSENSHSVAADRR
jgi:hypothetical protein